MQIYNLSIHFLQMSEYMNNQVSLNFLYDY